MARSNSFTTGFFGTCGAIAALVLVGLLWYSLTELGKGAASAADAKMASMAKQHALLALKRHGITTLGREVIAGEVEGKWVVSGPAMTREGRVAEIYVSFRVATTSQGRRWQLANVLVDGDVLVVDGEATD